MILDDSGTRYSDIDGYNLTLVPQSLLLLPMWPSISSDSIGIRFAVHEGDPTFFASVWKAFLGRMFWDHFASRKRRNMLTIFPDAHTYAIF